MSSLAKTATSCGAACCAGATALSVTTPAISGAAAAVALPYLLPLAVVGGALYLVGKAIDKS